MNTPASFRAQPPALKLSRSPAPSAEKWAATLVEERRRLDEDQRALREREANLRDYESRLRSLQAEIEESRTVAHAVPVAAGHGSASPVGYAGQSTGSAQPFHRTSSREPFAAEGALQTGWEKLHRAREILEAEQTHLRDDRIAIREQEAAVKRREAAVAQREADVAEREAMIRAATPPAVSVKEEESAVSKFTTAPFKIARAVLGGMK
ncbi:MAG: hypothetical protein V4773_15630 [Verrucomicrobiota bacterium]